MCVIFPRFFSLSPPLFDTQKTHVMTHKIAAFPGRKRKVISPLKRCQRKKQPPCLMPISALVARLATDPKLKVCVTLRHISLTHDACLQPISLTNWQAWFFPSKKAKKRLPHWRLGSVRFLSLSGQPEKNKAQRLARPTFSLQMAYSLTPHFLTLQNEAL
jgi:hypothetical protein